MQAPPPLPESSLRRMLAVARADGWSVVVIAGLGGISALWQRGWIEAAAALLVLLAGAGELYGRWLLLRGAIRGLRWLIGAQVGLLAVIWIYAWWRWRFFDPTAFWAELPAFAQAALDQQMVAAGLEPALDRPLLLRLMNTLTCALLALLTLLYQGGMAVYYTLKRHIIAEALREPPTIPGASSL